MYPGRFRCLAALEVVMSKSKLCGMWRLAACLQMAIVGTLLAWPNVSAWAQITSVKISGNTNFNVPRPVVNGVEVPAANVVTVDFSTTTLATANITASGDPMTTQTTAPVPASMSGTYAKVNSGPTTFLFAQNNTSTLTFQNPTPFVSFLWSVSDKSNSMSVKFTLSDNSTVLLENCGSGSGTCIGSYFSWSTFLGGLLDFLGLGSVNYGTVYISYQPPSGLKIKSIAFYVETYPWALIGNKTQDTFIDNISFVNAAVAPDHLEIINSSSSVATGTNTTYTINACGDASCSTHYISGVSGVLSMTGAASTGFNGAAFSIPVGSSSTTITGQFSATGTGTVGMSSYTPTPSNATKVWCGIGGVTPTAVTSCAMPIKVPLHHVNIKASNGLTCTPTTYTIEACADAACTHYTSGLTGTLTVTGSGMTVGYPSGQAFAITSGNWTTTVSAHITTAGTVTTATATGLSETTTGPSANYCGMNGVTPANGGSCNVNIATSGLLVSAISPHASDVAQTVYVTAVNSSNAAACTPAFASVTKNVKFKCSYGNPGTGTKPVCVTSTVSGVTTTYSLNAGNSNGAACDATGQSVSLAFDLGGQATTQMQYADVGQVNMTTDYSGSGSDLGLSMSGSASFIAYPYDFGVTVSSAPTGSYVAGSAFSATVTARNASQQATPNFGKEGTPESMSLNFVRVSPGGVSAVNGSLSGALGAISSGVASSSNLAWSEVGKIDITATLASGNYLGTTGAKTAGTSAGTWVKCADEGNACDLSALPAGTVSTVAFGASGQFKYLAGQSGSISCSVAVFTNPIVGTAKACYYIVTSGVDTRGVNLSNAIGGTNVAGAAGVFIPKKFNVAITQGCGSSFTYNRQPFSVKITAVNASGVKTSNYDGTANTSPNYAQAVTLSAPNSAGVGSLSTTSVLASAFQSGEIPDVSLLSNTFTFSAASPTAETSVLVRAVDANSVSSATGTEGSAVVRQGRLKLSNVFGSAKSTLDVPVQAQYWNGKAWIVNSQDSCTNIRVDSVALSNYLDAQGNAASAWTASPSSEITTQGTVNSVPMAVMISSGNGKMTLAAPPGGTTGSVDFAFNLGSGSSKDVSCLAQPTGYPTTTGSGLSGLRALYGSTNNCAGVTTYTRDPSGRVTFGVFTPETKKAVFVRDIY
jgi:hypothetical protein